VIIGGGIAGASAAYALASRCEVVLLEKEPFCGYHTTGRSAAIFTEAWEHGVPALLTLGSRAFLEHPPEGFSETPLLAPLSILIVGTEDQRATVEALALDATSRISVELLEQEDLSGVCPELESTVAVGVLERSGKEIDVASLHQGYLRGARARGADIVTGAEVASIERDAGMWTIRTGSDEYEADVIVNAAGAWSDEIATMAGVEPIDLQPMRRTAFAFEPASDIGGWPMVIDVDEQFYFKPEGHQVMGSLCEETPMHPHDVRPEEIDVALAIDRIQRATKLEIRHVKRTWAGLRTFTPDRDPVNGFDPHVEGFYWLAGQGGYGIMTSPAMGQIAAGLILDGVIPATLVAQGLDEATLSPARFRKLKTV
jgi:D-arginine dehydrogenase